MPYRYSDRQLNELNQGPKVYSVNDDYVERNETDKISIDSKIETSDDQQFRVTATESDPETGFDGMAVAPIVNGVPDYSSVAVIAAGTDPESEVNRPPLGIVSRDVASAIEARQDFLSPQYPVLDKFTQENPTLFLA